MFYVNNNNDIKSIYKSKYKEIIMHFINYGIKEGRQGSEDFNIIDYYNKCSNYIKNKLGIDYIKYYAYVAGGNVIEDEFIDINKYMFDFDLYFSLYPDLQILGYDYNKLKFHYYTFGIKEGRIASYIFDSQYYLKNNPDLLNAFGNTGYENAYYHFLNNGIYEGRKSSIFFEVKYYMKKYQDIQDSFGANYSKILEHFINNGIKEGRQGSTNFNIMYYKEKYEDLRQAFKNDNLSYYKHYITNGIKENRQAC